MTHKLQYGMTIWYLCIWSGWLCMSNVALTSALFGIGLYNFIIMVYITQFLLTSPLVLNFIMLSHPIPFNVMNIITTDELMYIYAQVHCSGRLLATAVTIASIICWHPFYYYTCVVMYHQSTHYVFYMLFVITTALLYVVICGSVTIGNYCKIC